MSLVQDAKKFQKTLKVLGSGHSPSDIGCVSKGGWLVSLDNLNQLLNVRPTVSFISFPGCVVLRIYQGNSYQP